MSMPKRNLFLYLGDSKAVILGSFGTASGLTLSTSLASLKHWPSLDMPYTYVFNPQPAPGVCLCFCGSLQCPTHHCSAPPTTAVPHPPHAVHCVLTSHLLVLDPLKHIVPFVGQLRWVWGGGGTRRLPSPCSSRKRAASLDTCTGHCSLHPTLTTTRDLTPPSPLPQPLCLTMGEVAPGRLCRPPQWGGPHTMSILYLPPLLLPEQGQAH